MPWGERWRGRWIWDRAPREAYWWRSTAAESHTVYLRRSFQLEELPACLPARATCDSRYVLFLNAELVGRGPVRGEPEFLGWDDYDLAPLLQTGANVLVALCRYYGDAGPWWLPASPLGTLGRGSFCFETARAASVDLVTDQSWRAVPSPWVPQRGGGMHSVPPEVVDGRLAPAGLHDAEAHDELWEHAVVVSGRGHGTVLDRPPAAPYASPIRRPIPQLTSRVLEPHQLAASRRARVELADDPVAAWTSLEWSDRGERQVFVWDVGCLTLAHVRLRVRGADAAAAGGVVDVAVGEDLRADGLPETRPRDWAARYLLGGRAEEHVTFFDPVGFRYLAAHCPPGVDVSLEAEETIYPREDGADFSCDDDRYSELWQVGARTVDVCSTDAFLDCPGREQRAWVADSYVHILVSYVTNPDWRLVRHHLALTARSRFPSGLLAGAAGCDFTRIGFTMPDYSLHWIRALASYWRYAGDADFVHSQLPVADAIVARYELQRGSSGLLEDFPGWVFLDWAQVDRDVVTGMHDALYAAALEAYAELPGASDVRHLVERTRSAFEALWDPERQTYVDAIGDDGPSRRISQQTNATALLAGLVPDHRVAGLIERIVDPGAHGLGQLVVTATPASLSASVDDPHAEAVPSFQYRPPDKFDPEVDVVAAQPWSCRFLHEALFRHGRRDLILKSLRRWSLVPGNGTFQEFWDAAPGTSSRCHGWSASPTYDLTSYVLGARPTSPGYRQAVVDPYLGPLVRVCGRVPTPHGWLAVAVDGDELSLEVPRGMTVTARGCDVGAGRHRLGTGGERDDAGA
ncbi:MAG: hypothetical protein ACR2KL_12380 [Nocardioidaceae bacterium]